jgi:hypothetical protein
MLGAPEPLKKMRFATLGKLDPTGWRVSVGTPLFPKAEAQDG